jgi:hypothetical protein
VTSASDLSALEREIQEKRQRLAFDLDRLRTMSRVKAELWEQAAETKDHLLSSAKDTVSAGMQEAWREVKARATANPAAALALGAGVAWRLIKSPPIASALVGVGLISLWRTDPRYLAPGADLTTRSGELFEAAKQRAEDAAAQIGERTVRSSASQMLQCAAKKLDGAVQASQDAIDAARQRGAEIIPAAAEKARAVATRVAALSPSEKERDQLLLEAAALALAAAVGIASQRRPGSRA